MSDTLRATADALVGYCREGASRKALQELYVDDAVSVEAGPGPDGSDPVSTGKAAIGGKHDWWEDNFEVHSASVEGPYLHGGDRFAVIFEMDTTHKASAQRSQAKEVAIYTTNGDGKIVREEFFYTM